MKILTISQKLILFFIFFLFLTIYTSKDVEAEILNSLDIEVINGVTAIQQEVAEALNEFEKFIKKRNKSPKFIQSMLHNHKLSIEELNKFRTGKKEEQELIDYEIPINDLNSEKKFLDFLIDLLETNVYSYKEALQVVENPKIRTIVNKVIKRDNSTLINLIELSKSNKNK